MGWIIWGPMMIAWNLVFWCTATGQTPPQCSMVTVGWSSAHLPPANLPSGRWTFKEMSRHLGEGLANFCWLEARFKSRSYTGHRGT